MSSPYLLTLHAGEKESSLSEPARINVDEIKQRMDKGESVLFIDTRNEQAWSEAEDRIPGAVRIHYSQLDKHLDKLPHDRPIVAYCT